MGARQKLNQAQLNGALVIAAEPLPISVPVSVRESVLF
jgi:hypothetical protein